MKSMLKIDTLDLTSYSLVGKQKSNKLTIRADDSDIIVAGIGITPYHKPIIYAKSNIYTENLSLNYKVKEDGSFVVIFAQTGWYDIDTIVVPSGFTVRVNQTTGDTWSTSYIATKYQNAGEYTVDVTLSHNGGASIVVYVFQPDTYTFAAKYIKGVAYEYEKTLTLATGYGYYLFSAGCGNGPINVIIECPECGAQYKARDYYYRRIPTRCLVCDYDESMSNKFSGTILF